MDAIKVMANENAKILVNYLQKTGLLGNSIHDVMREHNSETEEVLHNAAVAAYELARRIAAQ